MAIHPIDAELSINDLDAVMAALVLCHSLILG